MLARIGQALFILVMAGVFATTAWLTQHSIGRFVHADEPASAWLLVYGNEGVHVEVNRYPVTVDGFGTHAFWLRLLSHRPTLFHPFDEWRILVQFDCAQRTITSRRALILMDGVPASTAVQEAVTRLLSHNSRPVIPGDMLTSAMRYACTGRLPGARPERAPSVLG